ncbi:hypothetical protein [Bacillus sp. es.034]|uniref:hypothetical protein n=1 Tax=Bacillus sp. es.034 TaxID=1761763 RepID=UPI0015CF445B|nr:hypothetical protein [Bacillus sp. es.034]
MGSRASFFKKLEAAEERNRYRDGLKDSFQLKKAKKNEKVYSFVVLFNRQTKQTVERTYFFICLLYHRIPRICIPLFLLPKIDHLQRVDRHYLSIILGGYLRGLSSKN